MLVKSKIKKKNFSFYIDYESCKFMLRILSFFKTSSCSSYQLQLEAYCFLLHPKLRIKFYTYWNINWFKKNMPNCLSYLTVNLYLSFLFYINISVTIFKFKKWITIPSCFRNEKISYSALALNFNDWPFGIIVIRHFRPKSGHINDKVYCKPINKTVKMLFNEKSGNFLRPSIPELWELLVFE